EALQKIRQKNTMRREVTVELSSQGFWKTGIRSDVCQHAMMLPVLTHHIRYHQCLMHLDKLIGYVFKERCLLQGLLERRDPGRQRLPHYCAQSTSAGIVQVETGAQKSAKVCSLKLCALGVSPTAASSNIEELS
ncbi:ribonuclease 3-like protein, partial [Lates japonicus]